MNDQYALIADCLAVKRVTNVVGVKSRSAFSSNIEGLPVTATIDYMHCILIGVYPDLLKLHIKN